MVKKFLGGLISSTAPALTTNPVSASSGGFYDTSSATKLIASNSWPNFGSFLTNCLIVAGGGGGGVGQSGNHAGGGGGGAGGLVYLENVGFYFNLTYTITVGGGGTAATSPRSTNGGNSSIAGTTLANLTTIFGTNSPITANLTAIGGGGGGGNRGLVADGASGGSGGGSRTQLNFVQALGVYRNSAFLSSRLRQGYLGGNGQNGFAAAGGGGAGAVGGASASAASNSGGIGRSISITGTPVFYAGGGGAGSGVSAGGSGGGGAGTDSGTAGNGEANTGGGGGGAGVSGNAGNGGSGVVIIRYSASLPAPITAGNVSIAISGDSRVVTFTGSSTFRVPSP